MKSNPVTLIKRTIAIGLLAGSTFVVQADPVVFNVNMSVQSALGNFNAARGDTVLVSGTFNSWATTNVLAVTADPNVYSITQNLAALSWPNYKFIINPYGTNTGLGLVWETRSGDRWFQVPAGGTNVPVVYFSDATNAPGYFHITFEVNMGIAIAQGIFDMNSSTLYAFGSWNNWSSSGGLQLTNVPGTSNYMQTLDISNTLNSVIAYKYAINGYGGTWEGNVGPTNTSDRVCTLTNLTMILPLSYWNNVTNAFTNYVTFQVDMLTEYALGVFDTAYDYVYVCGDWNWSASAVQLFQTDNPYVYTNTAVLHDAPGSIVNYKYTISANIWEDNGVGPNGAQNHQFTLTTTNLPLDHFNNYVNLGPLVLSQSGSQTALSWASGSNSYNRIRLQNSSSLSEGWTDVPNTQGIGTITNDFGSGVQFFRLIAP